MAFSGCDSGSELEPETFIDATGPDLGGHDVERGAEPPGSDRSADPWDGDEPRSHLTRFRGKVTMHVGWNAYGGGGLLPSIGSTQPVPYLFVCIFDKDGSLIDFGEINDDVLACQRTTTAGNYDITIQRSDAGDVGPDIYLATWFCDNPDATFWIGGNGTASFTKSAQVCVRINERPWDTGSMASGDDGYSWPGVDSNVGGTSSTFYANQISNRKYLSTRVYDLTTELDGWDGTSEINWNLSCPNKSGDTHTITTISCDGSGPDAPTPTETLSNPVQNSNSNFFFNKEYVHMFRAGIQPVVRGWETKPTSGNVATGEDVCDTADCLREITLHLANHAPVCPAPLGGSDEWQWCPPDCRIATCPTGCEVSGSCPGGCEDEDPPTCSTEVPEHIRVCTSGSTLQNDYEDVCLENGSSLSAFTPIHEIGHAIDKRWRFDSTVNTVGDDPSVGGCSTSCLDPGDPISGTDERNSMAEGWCDFYSVAAWYLPTATAPYLGVAAWQVEPRTTPWLSGTCSPDTCGCSTGSLAGEGRPTQWIWDMYDYRVGDDDAMDLSSEARTVPHLQRMLSKFDRNGFGYLGADECGPDGRNGWDFRDAVLAVGESGWPSAATVDSVLTHNCVNKHRAGTQACAACAGCNCDIFDQDPYCYPGEGVCNATCQ